MYDKYDKSGARNGVCAQMCALRVGVRDKKFILPLKTTEKMAEFVRCVEGEGGASHEAHFFDAQGASSAVILQRFLFRHVERNEASRQEIFRAIALKMTGSGASK